MRDIRNPGSVVVGVDGSSGGDAALAWATRYAAHRRRSLQIVTAAHEGGHGIEFTGHDTLRRDLTAAARRVADGAAEQVHRGEPDLDVQVSTPFTDARQALLERGEDAALLVVGTRGRGPLRALLLGSVSEAVSAHAACPVAVVRPPQSGVGPASGHVVVGVDGSPASAGALDTAYDLATTEGSPVDVVHTWATHETLIDGPVREQRLDQHAEHGRWLSEALAGYAEKYPDVTTVRHLAERGAVETLVELSSTAAVVVVGSRPRSRLTVVPYSVSRAVVEQAHCTVLVVRS
jgi:nucleotide-binding universal stress UspA family protein